MLSIGEAAALLGVCTGTLRRLEREGKIAAPLRTLGGHRRYQHAVILKLYELQNGSGQEVTGKKVICYARVSGRDQVQERSHKNCKKAA